MKHLGIGLLVASTLFSGQALAEPGEKGQLAVGAERLMGFTHMRQTEEDDFGKQTTSVNNLSLLGNPMSGFVTAYSVPRIAFDYFPTDGLSLGGSISYTHVGFNYENEPTTGESSDDSSSFSTFILSPRVGYAYMFNDSVGIWPRAGITYITSSSEYDDGDSKSSALALSVEAPFLFTPVDNVAITFGPTIDYGLTASSESTDSDGTTTEDEGENPPHEFGAQAGITVFF